MQHQYHIYPIFLDTLTPLLMLKRGKVHNTVEPLYLQLAYFELWLISK